MKPVFFGLSGTSLSPAEMDLFAAVQPAGYILFRRNCIDRAQVSALTASLRALSGWADLPILIDQEGGRVARLMPPEWPTFPPAAAFDALYQRAPMTAIAAARDNAEALGVMLAEIGITVNCLPVLDLRYAETHAAIGDRAFGRAPGQVAALGNAVLAGLQRGGVVGVVKHMPGQGRAMQDSHMDCPVIDATEEELAEDIQPFQQLRAAPMAMAAHVVYQAWDGERPVTQSSAVVRDVIRRAIGFDGLLMTDDIVMGALSGPLEHRAHNALDAGYDIVLHCSGDVEEMARVADRIPDIREDTMARLINAMAHRNGGEGRAALPSLIEKRDKLMAMAA